MLDTLLILIQHLASIAHLLDGPKPPQTIALSFGRFEVGLSKEFDDDASEDAPPWDVYRYVADVQDWDIGRKLLMVASHDPQLALKALAEALKLAQPDI